MFFLFIVQIPSRVRSRIIRGPIDLKLEGGIRDSLVLNLNGEIGFGVLNNHLSV